MESQSDLRLQDLAGKLSSIRQVTNDIYAQASDHGMIDAATDSFGSAMGSIKSGALRLTRAAQAGHPVFKVAGMALGVIFLFYFLFHFFY